MECSMFNMQYLYGRKEPIWNITKHKHYTDLLVRIDPTFHSHSAEKWQPLHLPWGRREMGLPRPTRIASGSCVRHASPFSSWSLTKWHVGRRRMDKADLFIRTSRVESSRVKRKMQFQNLAGSMKIHRSSIIGYYSSADMVLGGGTLANAIFDTTTDN